MVDETLHLVVRSDVSASIKLLKSAEATLVSFFCAALLLISLLGIPVSLHLVRPLKRLQEKVEAFIETIVGRRIQIDKGNEIDRLTAAWDIMNQTLQQHLREIDRSRQKAEEANRTKSEFLANMSHELRTPLNHIIGFTELVLSRGFGDLTAEQEEFLKDVLASSRHLLSLINDVLDLSKVEAGKMTLDLCDVRIRELLENSLVMVKEKALKNQLRLAVELDGVPELLQLDERKIKQVVYNLLSNAVKFTPAGGEVRLGAAIQDAAQLSACPISTEGHAKWLSVWVADTGIGLDAKDLERIFCPFEQVEGSASRKFQGTGLGLSLTRKVVELHSGAIWAESRGCGKGSAFRFVVPARAVQS
jgi:signal transduction histidine kinase